MNNDYIIPATYEEWRNCIEARCKTPLTPAYIDGRLVELLNGKHPKTKHFEELYGTEHLQQIIAWFRRAAEKSPLAQTDT